MMSKAWERRGLGLAAARALVNAGILTVGDLQTAQDLELASIPRIGSKSIAKLSKLRTSGFLNDGHGTVGALAR